MQDNIKMIKDMDLEHFNLQMVENMLANGCVDYNMDQDNLQKIMDKLQKEFGERANQLHLIVD